jgi:hypothetical protein
VEQAQDTAEQSWTVYFDLENAANRIKQHGHTFIL